MDKETMQKTAHVEQPESKDLEQDTPIEEFSPAEQRRIKRRIDRRLVATCGVMYCISLIDRTNLSAAAIAGMTTELNLVGDRYVSQPSALVKLTSFADSIATVHPRPPLLHHLHPAAAACDRPFAQNRPAAILGWHLLLVGNCNGSYIGLDLISRLLICGSSRSPMDSFISGMP